MCWNSGPQIVRGSLYSWEFLGIPRNSKSSQNWSLPFPEIPSNSKLFKSELICIVGNFWEFLGIPRRLGIQFARVICIIGNFWETGNSVCKGSDKAIQSCQSSWDVCFNSFYSLLYLLQNLEINIDDMGGDWFWGLNQLLKCHPLAHKMWDDEKSLTEVFVSCFKL